jgi:hypothetical protein
LEGKGELEEGELEEDDHSRDHRAKKEMHMYHSYVI